ncbi:Zn-ribbon domain-containing OB-fold protein [Halegenticoccus soli]|uniref:Zn-ribbon domain-containing OB-fold protein n=1 Tax=Halegenticoccus soli TaxID=1985678 RepID=UPI000C6E0719|nr:OB-fold domain-containing protein [Halegenticoccus soli]
MTRQRATAATLDRGFRCSHCDRRWYYTRPACPDCGGGDAEPIDLGVGELVTRTVVRVTPPDVRSPNALGLARFDLGVQLVAQLADPSLEPGDAVRLDGKYPLRGNDASAIRGPRLRPATEYE